MSTSIPFSATPSPAGAIPPQAVLADQPPPPPEPPRYDRQYHSHTFRARLIPQVIGGWTVDRMRAAIDLHDQGSFWESSILAIAITRYAPIFAALKQRIAPVVGLPRQVLGGTRGLARIVAEEIRAQLAPRDGDIPHPTWPAYMWGSTAVAHAMMGFAVWQHVWGDPQPDGTRLIYSRPWPTSAVQCIKYRRTYQALTEDGPVDIIDGDGKWSLIGDTDFPHYDGAVRALGAECLAGMYAQASRNSYADRHGDPKPVGTMPDKMVPNSPEGDAFFDAMYQITEPGAYAALPHGSDIKMLEASAQTSSVFKDILDNVWQHVAAALLGSDGTMSKGTGVYSAPVFAGVRLDLVRTVVKAIMRALNVGRIRPYVAVNYGLDRVSPLPALDLPLPDVDKDARTKSYGDRVTTLHAILAAEKDNGCDVTQERVNQLAASLDVEAPTLAKTPGAHALPTPSAPPPAAE